MNANDIQKQRDKLLAEKASIEKLAQRRRQESERDQRRYDRIDDALLRLACLELLDVAGGVVLRTRLPRENCWSKLNDAAGTLVAVRRTRGTVDFGELGRVTVRLDNLLPASERYRQGFIVTYGGAR